MATYPVPVRRLFRPLAALGALVLALLLVEFGLRLLDPPPLTAIVRTAASGMAMAVDDGRVFAGRPGFSEGLYTLDGRGLRSSAVPGPCSVLVLGDSVAFGHGVEAAEAFPSLLGAPAHNLSFPGWNSAQEAAALEVLGPELPAGLLVVAWVPNDAASLEWEREGPEGSPLMYVERRVRLLPGLDQDLQIRIWTRSALWRRVSDTLGGEHEILLEAREHRRAIARIADLARQLRLPTLFVMIPPLLDPPGWAEPWAPGRPAAPYTREPAWIAARTAAQDAGLTVLDATAAFAGSRPSSLALDRVHPSAAGHARLAAWLGPIARAELPGRCGP